MMAEKKKAGSKKMEAKKEAPVKQEAKIQAAPAPKQAPAKAQAAEGKKEQPRIGVFICHCGTNIAGSMDIAAVKEYSKTIQNVAYVDDYKYMCSMPGQAVINKAIKDNKLTGVVVAACSPRLHAELMGAYARQGRIHRKGKGRHQDRCCKGSTPAGPVPKDCSR